MANSHVPYKKTMPMRHSYLHISCETNLMATYKTSVNKITATAYRENTAYSVESCVTSNNIFFLPNHFQFYRLQNEMYSYSFIP